MRVSRSRLLSTSAIRLALPEKNNSTFGEHGSVTPITPMSGSASSRRSIGIMLGGNVRVPFLSAPHISRIRSKDIKSITRHFSSKDLERTLSGSFKFGSISGYRAADTSQIGRFSDFQEGLQREVFRNRHGLYNGSIMGSHFENVYVSGMDDPIVYQFHVNDYCSCSSIGPFSKERAELIRDRGNPDISAYAVYDLDALQRALMRKISKHPDFRDHRILTRRVEYGQKDRQWEVEGRFKISAERDQIALWLGTAFVKSPDYAHEEELRMLLIDPRKAGQLEGHLTHAVFADNEIASAIIDHGLF